MRLRSCCIGSAKTGRKPSQSHLADREVPGSVSPDSTVPRVSYPTVTRFYRVNELRNYSIVSSHVC